MRDEDPFLWFKEILFSPLPQTKSKPQQPFSFKKAIKSMASMMVDLGNISQGPHDAEMEAILPILCGMDRTKFEKISILYRGHLLRKIDLFMDIKLIAELSTWIDLYSTVGKGIGVIPMITGMRNIGIIEFDDDDNADYMELVRERLPTLELLDQTLVEDLLSKLYSCKSIMYTYESDLPHETKILMTARHIVGLSCFEQAVIAHNLYPSYLSACCRNYLALTVTFWAPDSKLTIKKFKKREEVYLDNFKELILQISAILKDNEYQLAVDNISPRIICRLLYKSCSHAVGYSIFDDALIEFLNSADIANDLKAGLLLSMTDEIEKRETTRGDDRVRFQLIDNSFTKTLSDRDSGKINMKAERRLDEDLMEYFFDDVDLDDDE